MATTKHPFEEDRELVLLVKLEGERGPDDPTMVRIRRIEAGQYMLEWTDSLFGWGCNGEYEEIYDSLDVAIARVAALARCASTEWRYGFSHAPALFHSHAVAFIGNVAEDCSGEVK